MTADPVWGGSPLYIDIIYYIYILYYIVQCNVMSQCGDGQTLDEVNLFLT